MKKYLNKRKALHQLRKDYEVKLKEHKAHKAYGKTFHLLSGPDRVAIKKMKDELIVMVKQIAHHIDTMNRPLIFKLLAKIGLWDKHD